ncbi:MAG TPA: DNA internalization-related competence protein ComEC/Rec2 [Gemmatimonadales bacterium]|nr:DNA internalization-related competence protein ComEC/Rec2 [Gemmatimonadales bacterium]
MRPVQSGMLFVLAFEAGLLTGLSHFWAPACVLTLIAMILAGGNRRRFAGLALLLGAGLGRIGQATNAHSCAARLSAGAVTVRVRLHDPGTTRGLVSVAPLGLPCGGLVTMRVQRAEELPAGRVVTVRGRWLPRRGLLGQAGGILLASSLAGTEDHATVSERIRTGLARASRSLYGSRAALVEALVLGTRGNLDQAIKDDFAASGLVHLLSISGFHVGLIVAWLVLAVSAMGFDRQRALWCGAAFGMAYAGFLGWPAPATRAAVLCVLGAWQLQRQRHAALGPLLGFTCVIVSIGDPWAIVSVGAWLSVMALAGAAWAAEWCERAVSGRALVKLVASSSGATLATAPITAAAFGTIPIAGIALNLVAIPLAALAVPGVIASLLLHGISAGLAGALAAGAGLGLHGLEIVAHLGARIPHGCLMVAPGLRSALGASAVLAVGLWAAGRHVTAPVAARRVGVGLALASWCGVILAIPRGAHDGAAGLSLHFLDVGQGDAAVIRTPHGHWILVDAGPRSATSDAGKRIVAPFLAQERVRRLDAMVISHAHADHVGGAAAVLDHVDAGVVIEPGELVADPVYTDFLSAVAADGATWRSARAGMRFELDSVRFTLLHPDTTWSGWGLDLNEDSAVLLVEYRGFRALLAGDAGFPAESLLHGRVGPVDLLKVGHHGSRWASGDAWLAELRPDIGIVSVGVNRYGHPSPEALRRLEAHHVSVWRTDRDGSITVSTDGRRFSVAGRNRRSDYPTHAEEMEP